MLLRGRPSSDSGFTSDPFSHEWEGAPTFFWSLTQEELKLNTVARILLPLVGEPGPARRGRTRALAIYPRPLLPAIPAHSMAPSETEASTKSGHPA